MKWIIGSFAHETNTFSTVPTDLDAFRAQTCIVGEEIPAAFRNTRTPIGGFLDVIDERGDTPVFTVAAHATPSGLVTTDAYRTLSGHILDGIRAAPDADGVLLALHGAMVAEGIDDGEGHLLRQIREISGPDLPIVVVLDLHSHITKDLVEAATAIIGYQEYPHTDTYERGVEAARLIDRIAAGEIRPVAALNKPPMIPVCGTCHTRAGAYKDLWAEALRPDRPPEILATSLFAGFSYADIPPMGYAVLVYTDGAPDIARTEADRLAQSAWDRRKDFLYTPTPIPEAVSRALKTEKGPVVIADIADNPGGGGSNDGVEILRELLQQNARSAAIATIYDPDVVRQAVQAGIDGPLTTTLGAKTDDLHGRPLEIRARVRLLFDGRFQYKGPMTRGSWGSLGTTAVLDIDGIQVIVCSKRLQSRDPEIFRAAGIDPLDCHILVLKSAVHFRAGFEPMASAILIADGPGLTSLDLPQFPYRRIRRPIFPLDEI